MDYETMDWHAEAKRVARAFGIKEECAFYPNDNSKVLLIEPPTGPDDDDLPIQLQSGCSLVVEYYAYFRCYSIYLKPDGRGVAITYSGELERGATLNHRLPAQLSLILAAGLFHLDLLTPEVEAELKISISAHQKLEWTLEYESR